MNSKIKNYRYFMIVDLEATCCDRQTIKRQDREMIEIGAVMVDASELTSVDEFQIFIKPVKHPQLTEFCKQLTSITQVEVDNAPAYPEAVARFKNWMQQYDNFLFCSWGDYDKNQFIQDCQLHNIPYPIAAEHLNIKKRFASNQGMQKKLGLAEALNYAGLSLSGTYHRGIDDARNMAKLMPYIVGHEKIVKQL